MGLTVQTLKASTDREIDAAFASLVQARTGALLAVGTTTVTDPTNLLFDMTGFTGRSRAVM